VYISKCILIENVEGYARGMRFDDYDKKDVCIDVISIFFLYFTNGVVIK
jgi:hypothetical protein